MATVYGFEYETPEEIKARKLAEFQQQASQGDLGAYARQTIFNIFGDPELKKAQATSKVITEALGSFTDDPDKDPLENEMARAKTLRDAAVRTAPELAVQANDRYLRARNEFEERQRLFAERAMSDKKAQLELEESERKAINDRTPVIYKIGPDGFEEEVIRLTPEATREEIKAAMQQAGGGRLGVTSATEFDKLRRPWQPRSGSGIEGLEDVLGGDVPNSFKGQYLNSLTSATVASREFMNVIEQVKADPFVANPTTADLSKDASSVISGVNRIVNMFYEDIPEELQGQVRSEDEAMIESTTQYLLENEYAGARKIIEMGGRSSTAMAQIRGLAYVVAKTLDPTGRLSDQDVRIAMEMLIGDGNPETLSRLFEQRMASTNESIQVALEMADRGQLLGEVGINAAGRYRTRYSEAQAALLDLNNTIRKRKGGDVKVNGVYDWSLDTK